jgi:hypothetical protein
MKIRKNYKVFGIIILSILIIGLYYFNFIKKKEIPLNVLLEQNYSKEYIKEKTLKPTQVLNKENLLTEPNVKTIKVSLIVLDKKYEIEIKENSTVFEVMKKIKADNVASNLFNFNYKENAGMGSFITGINGKDGSPGKYWIYYVNDKKAAIGVSNYKLKEGDIISWKQEGI